MSDKPNTSTNFVIPYFREPDLNDAIRRSNAFIPSSRIEGMLLGKKSAGASCNVYEVDDNLEDIANAFKWAIHVLGYQGAPSIHLGKLRPEGSPISTGGTASGALSFAIPFDKHFATMRRTEKKNGAGLLSLPWNYEREELKKFLRYPFDAAYRSVTVPMHDTPEAAEFLADEELLKLLANAYDNFSTFLVKDPGYLNGEKMFINLCTEVRIPKKGTCVLGAINAASFNLDNILYKLPLVMADAADSMYAYMVMSNEYIQGTPIACNSPNNNQFGLGLFGLASFLGVSVISYAEFGDALHDTIDRAGGDGAHIDDVFYASTYKTPAHLLVAALAKGYAYATENVVGKVNAAFTFQPTVSTAHRSYDRYGYVSSPELQPVQGIRHEDAVSTIVKSAQKGDKLVDYHPATWTVQEVPYEDYARVSSGMQRLINSTGLAHRHSHCYYGDKFTTDTLRAWYTDKEYKQILSLYYRLKFANNDSLKKDTLWQDTTGIIDADFDLDSFLQGAAQEPGQITCDCEG